MSIIPPKDQETLRARFQRDLPRPVKMVLFTRKSKLLVPGQECESCEDTERLLEEVASLSENLTLEVHDAFSSPEEALRFGADPVPFIAFQADGETNVRFSGIPLGYEFATLLEAVTALSSGVSTLKPPTLEFVKTIDEDVRIQVFVTPG